MNYIKTFFTDKPVSKCILTNLSLFMQKRIRGMTILLKMKRGGEFHTAKFSRETKRLAVG